MKICSFCNTENEDSAVQCISCGANSFKHKCNNCGTVFTDGVHCPHCGVKIDQQARICPKCHTQYYSNACPTCGFVPNNSTANNTGQPVQPVKPKRKTWLWVLGWIFIFPLPLTLILIKKQNINKGLKLGIIIAAWVVYAIFVIIGMASNGNDPKSINQIKSKETIAATEVTTVNATQKETAAPTEAEPTKTNPTEPPSEKPATPPTEASTPIEFTYYTNYVEAGETATVKIQGAPNTEYSIDVYYGSSESKAKGLEKKTSDSSGVVSWEWIVGTNTSKGEHSITVRGGGTSETVEFTVG